MNNPMTENKPEGDCTSPDGHCAWAGDFLRCTNTRNLMIDRHAQ
jgi:hypothetical protein